VVSAAAGAIFEVVSVVTDVESFDVSVVEEPSLQAAKNAVTQIASNTIFILINLDFYNLFLIYTII
jgi:hypothetical protein